MLPGLSVVVPTHNRARIVPRAIQSVLSLRDRVSHLEIIVVNDGSSDNTSEVLQGFGHDIQVIESSHGERSRARNAGLAAVSQSLTAFLDDDDLCVAEGWAQLLAVMQAQSDLSFTFGMAEFVDKSGNVLEYSSHPEQIRPEHLFFDLLARGCHICMGTVIAKTEKLRATGGFPVHLNAWEDWDLWLKMSRAGSAAFVDQVCARIFDPAWDTPGSHNWPAKLQVRCGHALGNVNFKNLSAAEGSTDLTTFYEQLACDCFTYKMYRECDEAFRFSQLASPSSRLSFQRRAQWALAKVLKLTAVRTGTGGGQ